jgi:hypothetical protein
MLAWQQRGFFSEHAREPPREHVVDSGETANRRRRTGAGTVRLECEHRLFDHSRLAIETEVHVVSPENALAFRARRSDDSRGRVGTALDMKMERPRMDGRQPLQRRFYFGGYFVQFPCAAFA